MIDILLRPNTRYCGRLAVLVLACLTCLGCFCAQRDALPASQGEYLKAVPDGVWLTLQPGNDPDGPAEENRLALSWNEAERAYLAKDPTGQDPAALLIRFYSLGSPPYYAVLAMDQIPEEGDDCPAALFLARLQEGVIELVLPEQVDEAEHQALMDASGVSMVEGSLSGPPEGLKAYLLGLADMGALMVLQRYDFQGFQ